MVLLDFDLNYFSYFIIIFFSFKVTNRRTSKILKVIHFLKVKNIP